MKEWYDSEWSRGMPTYSSMLKVTTFSNEIWQRVSGLHLGRMRRAMGSDWADGAGRRKHTRDRTHLAGLVLFDKGLVDAEGRGAGGQTEDKGVGGRGLVGVDAVHDVVGYIAAGGLGIVADNQSHDDVVCVGAVRWGVCVWWWCWWCWWWRRCVEGRSCRGGS